MKVCTSEESSLFNCYRMIKKCCGAQCMAWEEMGDNGFCGALPKSEIMQKAVESFGGVPNYEPYPFHPARNLSTIPEVLPETTAQPGTIEHGMIISEHQPTNAMPTQVQAVALPLDNLQSQTIHGHSHEVNLPELASPHNHINPQPKHNKHKGAR